MQSLLIILIPYLLGILTQRIINYCITKRENAKALIDLKNLQERMEANIKQVTTSTFDGIITLITGEKIESEFFHRLSDDVFVDRKNNSEYLRNTRKDIILLKQRAKEFSSEVNSQYNNLLVDCKQESVGKLLADLQTEINDRLSIAKREIEMFYDV